MSKWPEDFEKYVLDDLRENADSRKVIKAGLIERYMQRYCDPHIIHSNPTDEFTHEDVGPHFGIVGKYVDEALRLQALQQHIFEEALIVEKLEGDGYILLNGHHRWFACLRSGIKKVHIQIVNLVHAEDMHRMIEESNNDRRVTFDLDEVLYAKNSEDEAVLADPLFSRRIPERLRKGAPEVIRKIKELGYDVWVYTESYNSEEYIRNFFSMYEIEISGIVNGFNDKRDKEGEEFTQVKEMMANKYKQVIHIDNDAVIVVDTNGRSYEQYDIYEKEDVTWSEGINEALKKVNIIIG